VREDGTKVHSDVCPAECDAKNLTDPKYRAFLHEVLDEWLDNSGGTCGFYIKDQGYCFDH